MDAVEFIRERNRMCVEHNGCADCPASGVACGNIVAMRNDSSIVQIVEEWAKKHPRKTRQSEFLRQWPEADIRSTGLPNIAPCQLYKELKCRERCKQYADCNECSREFWGQEVE